MRRSVDYLQLQLVKHTKTKSSDRHDAKTSCREKKSKRYIDESDGKFLSDLELLEIVLNHPGKTKLEHILRFCSLKELFFADVDKIKAMANISNETIRSICCIRELIERTMHEKLENNLVITSIDDVIDYFKVTISASPREQLHALFLNGNRLIADSIESLGSVNAVTICIRSIIKKSLNLEASALLLIHNHPSGMVKPSQHDVNMTKKLSEAALKVNIQLLDHVIIGRGGEYYSMKEAKIID